LRPGSEGQLGEPNLSDKWDCIRVIG